MGIRFRKRIKIAPGIKVNVTSKGVTSASIGKRGLTVNLNDKGARYTASAPGTGLSYTSKTHKFQPNRAVSGGTMNRAVCTSCGHIGSPKTVTKGSIFIEIILWLCFLVPGIIYSIWRMTTRHQACRQCEQTTIIPVDSPMGKKFIRENLGDIAPPAPREKPVNHAAVAVKKLGGLLRNAKEASGRRAAEKRAERVRTAAARKRNDTEPSAAATLAPVQTREHRNQSPHHCVNPKCRRLVGGWERACPHCGMPQR